MFPIRLTKCKLSEEGIQYSKVKAVLDLGKLQSEVERSGTKLCNFALRKYNNSRTVVKFVCQKFNINNKFGSNSYDCINLLRGIQKYEKLF